MTQLNDISSDNSRNLEWILMQVPQIMYHARSRILQLIIFLNNSYNNQSFKNQK